MSRVLQLRAWSTAAVVSLSAAAAAVTLSVCASASQPALVTVDATVKYQRMTGWEAVAQAGQANPNYSRWRDTVLALAAGFGINRLRVEAKSGMEARLDYAASPGAPRRSDDAYRCSRYATTNDNADPRVIDWNGFKFTELDRAMERVVLPFREVIRRRGERLVINVTYVGFLRQCPPGTPWAHDDPEEYAEFALATILHLKKKYGIVPDLWEMILEPDNTGRWDGEAMGRRMVATARRLREAGFPMRMVAPSTARLSNALPFVEGISRVPGAIGLVSELSYHRYGGASAEALRTLSARAKSLGIGTAMLEKIGAGYEELYDDITLGRASAWEQYTLAFPGSASQDGGGSYFRVNDGDLQKPRVIPGERTRFLGLYFRSVRLGARRVGASSNSDVAQPVAFVNPDGRMAVVVKTTRGVTFGIAGLNPGQYDARYATSRADGLAHSAVAKGGVLTVSIPGAGVIAVVARKAGVND
jgi:hypothetical protein